MSLTCSRKPVSVLRRFSSQRGMLYSSNEDIEVSKGPEIIDESSSLSKNTASHSHRKAFARWMATKGRQHESAPRVPGTNYLDGKTHPFPLNPQFQPQAPLSRTVKDQLYDSWKAGTGLRQLGQAHGISLERIEAIIKLQEIRNKWSQQGREQMISYAESMANMLGSSELQSSDYEPRTNITIDPGRQVFSFIPESQDYTPQDAARELQRVPFSERKETQEQNFLKRSKYEHFSAFESLVNRGNKSSVILQEAEKGTAAKWSYTIKDLSTSQRLVRGNDGTLSTRLVDTSKWSRQ